jgi:hypothetical protein
MRSYYAHLKISQNVSNGTEFSQKPAFRSSGIFPVLNNENITTRLIFFGYWFLKRGVQELGMVLTLRDEKGGFLCRHTHEISESKSYRIELKDLMKDAGKGENDSFTGSLEIEFFSAKPLFYPFPGVSVNYYGRTFSTVVHTAQRVYNDLEDMISNSAIEVPESGFNIYATDDKEPFIALINGPEAAKNSRMKLAFINADNETLNHELSLGDLLPYETKFIYPSRETPLKNFLKGKVGSVKVSFDVKWIFPRLIVGNFQKSLSALSITHSYYDCTKAIRDSDYWLKSDPEWHSAALMLPLAIADGYETHISFYPIYSPSTFSISFEVYDIKGKLLGRKDEALKVTPSNQKFISLNINDLCKELEIPPSKQLAIRLIADPIEDEPIPARIKVALDIGKNPSSLPCNICTNLLPFNPELQKKEKSFRWAPLLADQKHSSAWIMNSTPKVNATEESVLTLTFYREHDTETLVRTLTMRPHTFIVIRPEEDPELIKFFEGTIGWFSLVTTNPYTSTYYFAENDSGVVGGDHGY